MASEPVPPIDLLIALLADRPDEGLTSDPETWAVIREHAPRYGVAQTVAFTARSRVPPSEREWCDRVLARSWNKHRQNIRDLEYTLDVLDRAGIATIALKGPVMAMRHYAPAFLRKPSIDIDLLVFDRDLEGACESLYAAGYRTLWSVPESRARSHHVRLVHSTRPMVELHFQLNHFPYAIAADELFLKARNYEIPGGRIARILDPADEILHLVLHNAQHRFASFFHFSELYRIWAATGAPVRAEAVGRAIRHHLAGAFAITDVAFRSSWGKPFLDDGTPLPRTWLNGRINERLYKTSSSLSENYEWRAAARRRWVDFQLTDRPLDAALFAADLLRLGWYRAGRWLTGRNR